MTRQRAKVLARRVCDQWLRKGERWTPAEDRALLRAHTRMVAAGVPDHQLWAQLARKHSRPVRARYELITRMASQLRALERPCSR